MEDSKVIEMFNQAMQQQATVNQQLLQMIATQGNQTKETMTILNNIAQSMNEMKESMAQVALYTKSTSQNTRDTVRGIEQGNTILKGMSGLSVVLDPTTGKRTEMNVAQAAYNNPDAYNHDGISQNMPGYRKAMGPQDNFSNPDIDYN